MYLLLHDMQIESLMNDEDYRSRISRTQLEDACVSFANKFGGPIQDALSKAGLQIVSSRASRYCLLRSISDRCSLSG